MKLTVIVAIIVCVAMVEGQSQLAREILKRKLADIIARRLEDMPIGESSSDYARGKSYNGQRYDNGASGSEGAAYHNSGRRNFHDIGHHHNKVTKITQAESSDSHNIGGSEVYDNAAAAGGHFHRHNNGARESANDYARGNEQSISA